jgi:hypothetical protein
MAVPTEVQGILSVIDEKLQDIYILNHYDKSMLDGQCYAEIVSILENAKLDITCAVESSSARQVQLTMGSLNDLI